MKNSSLSNVVVLTINEENEKMIKNLTLGGYGYFTKTILPEEFLSEINKVKDVDSTTNIENARKMVIIFQELENNTQAILSDRENEVLSELALGKKYKQIAEKLFVSVNTIHFHMKNIYQKLNVHSRHEAIATAFGIGLK